MQTIDNVQFFKLEEVFESGQFLGKQWHKYHEINQSGFIYFIKGNTQMQITNQSLIYFYSVS